MKDIRARGVRRPSSCSSSREECAKGMAAIVAAALSLAAWTAGVCVCCARGKVVEVKNVTKAVKLNVSSLDRCLGKTPFRVAHDKQTIVSVPTGDFDSWSPSPPCTIYRSPLGDGVLEFKLPCEWERITTRRGTTIKVLRKSDCPRDIRFVSPGTTLTFVDLTSASKTL
jgi:hypothetical protein